MPKETKNDSGYENGSNIDPHLNKVESGSSDINFNQATPAQECPAKEKQ
jgi:hypothetical protein